MSVQEYSRRRFRLRAEVSEGQDNVLGTLYVVATPIGNLEDLRRGQFASCATLP